MVPVLETFFENGKFGYRNYLNYDQPVALNEYEAVALKIIYEILGDRGGLRVQRRTDAYLTVLVGEHGDFCRLKLTDRTRWMSLDLWNCPERLRNDAQMNIVKNKNQRHWKIPLRSAEDIRNYSEYIIAAYETDKNISQE